MKIEVESKFNVGDIVQNAALVMGKIREVIFKRGCSKTYVQYEVQISYSNYSIWPEDGVSLVKEGSHE